MGNEKSQILGVFSGLILAYTGVRMRHRKQNGPFLKAQIFAILILASVYHLPVQAAGCAWYASFLGRTVPQSRGAMHWDQMWTKLKDTPPADGYVYLLSLNDRDFILKQEKSFFRIRFKAAGEVQITETRLTEIKDLRRTYPLVPAFNSYVFHDIELSREGDLFLQNLIATRGTYFDEIDTLADFQNIPKRLGWTLKRQVFHSSGPSYQNLRNPVVRSGLGVGAGALLLLAANGSVHFIANQTALRLRGQTGQQTWDDRELYLVQYADSEFKAELLETLRARPYNPNGQTFSPGERAFAL